MIKTCSTLTLLAISIMLFAQVDDVPVSRSYIGSSTVGNFITDAKAVYPQVSFNIDTEPESTGGEHAIREGKTDLAGIARLPSKEIQNSGINATLIGWDAIAIIVNNDNPIENITAQQLKDIYIGKITNWQELGGKNIPIQPYIVDIESATRKVCRSIILGREDYLDCQEISPDRDIISRVQNDLGGLGQISFSFIKDNQYVKTVRINDQALELENRNYPITRPLYLLWRQGDDAISDFVQWTTSYQGQNIIMQRFIGISEATVSYEEEKGKVIVYNNTIPIEDGGIYYYPHEAYDILLSDHSLLVSIPNHLSNNDENPTPVELPPGDYIVRTGSDSQDLHEYAFTITANKLVSLYPEKKKAKYREFKNNATKPKNTVVHQNVLQQINFFGDFRIRAEQDIKDESNRFRGRFRIRAGMFTSLSPRIRVGFRLVSTGNPNDPNSTHVNLNDGFNQIKVAFDRAYIHYQSKHNSDNGWWMGKFSNPNTSTKIYSQIPWDADIQPEGIALSWGKKISGSNTEVRLTSGAYLISQFKTNNRKTWLGTSQLSSKIKIAENWSLALASGIYYFHDIEGLDVTAPFIDSNDGNSYYESIIQSGNDFITKRHYSTDFYTWDNFMTITTTIPQPLTVKIQWLNNLGADNDNTGYSAGVSYGSLKKVSNWLIYYQYSSLDRDVLFTPYAQDDALSRVDTDIHFIGVAYKINKKMSSQFTTMIDKSKSTHVTDKRLRLDLNVKF